jgi:uncharacterized membrane protein YphA (DoxX/SURF4 family)
MSVPPATAAVSLADPVSVAVPAHVRYVVDGGTVVDAWSFLTDALSDPVTLGALAAGTLALVVALVGYVRYRPARRDVRAFRSAMAEYRDLLPWLVRLSLGLPLVGAGFVGYFFTPLVGVASFEPLFGGASGAAVRLFGVGVGFLLLFGLATRTVAAVGLLAYGLGVVAFGTPMLFAFEYVPGLLAVVLLGGGRPSADHVLAGLADDDRTLYSRVDPVYRRLAVPFGERVAPYRRFVPTVTRVGLGLTFAFLGVAEKLAAPGLALATVEKYDLTAVVPVAPELWVVGAGLAELLVGVVLILGLFTRTFAAVALLLFTTTLFGLPDDPVLAHVSLFGLASALMITGSGPLSLDDRLADRTTARENDEEATARTAD